MNSILSLILLLFVFTPFAVEATPLRTTDVQSEFQHQANEKALELSADAGLAKEIIDNVPSGTTDNTAFMLEPAIEYGLSPFFSVGFVSPYIWNWVDIDTPSLKSGTTVSSWGDPSVFVKFQKRIGFGTIHAQLLYSRSIDSMSDDKNYSGADSITPAIGYEVVAVKGIIGARLEYKTYIEDRQLSVYQNQLDYKIKGGQTTIVQLFYEHPSRIVTYGFSLEVMSRSRSTMTAESSYAIDRSIALGLDPSRQYAAPLSSLSIEGYLPINVTSKIRLVPRLIYEVAQAFDKTAASSASDWQVGLLGRMQF